VQVLPSVAAAAAVAAGKGISCEIAAFAASFWPASTLMFNSMFRSSSSSIVARMASLNFLLNISAYLRRWASHPAPSSLKRFHLDDDAFQVRDRVGHLRVPIARPTGSPPRRSGYPWVLVMFPCTDPAFAPPSLPPSYASVYISNASFGIGVSRYTRSAAHVRPSRPFSPASFPARSTMFCVGAFAVGGVYTSEALVQ